jgi:hypothetical protein
MMNYLLTTVNHDSIKKHGAKSSTDSIGAFASVNLALRRSRCSVASGSSGQAAKMGDLTI